MSVYEKMPPIVSKLKGEKFFSVTLYVLRETLCRLAPPPPRPLPSFSDVAKARCYFAATVQAFLSMSSVTKICIDAKNVSNKSPIGKNETFYAQYEFSVTKGKRQSCYTEYIS
jgi:hypothetical protein